ncbi:threalose-6-phosphate phosphatase [Verticillium nonalfalfae]|uniref:Threalose-6-phosphate phosphatase n=1 Tax=Verticillium nonalfalfae TaxID=1051616 RepID=A0A3M9YES0_9PEZI|nr:threalose-6-phosphate phosphatase [Verticillium nonalfalfae]RNJ58904.1 threalose-6-phosphate phosphatase [Verticillium nonalfalfae]
MTQNPSYHLGHGHEPNRPASPSSLSNATDPSESPVRGLSSRAAAAAYAATPGIHLETYDSPSEGGQSYFHHNPQSYRQSAAVPAVAKNTEEVNALQLLTLETMARRHSIDDVRNANPDLPLSGNIISATFNIPHSFKYHQGSDWELKPRRGQSALFESFTHLSSEATPWNHTVVAWTGEIDVSQDVVSPPGTPPTTTVHMPGLSSLSAPVPIDGTTRLPTPPVSEGIWVSKKDQLRLEEQLSHNKIIKTVPVWLSDDHESTDEGIHLKDQARWRRYAEHDLYTLFHYKQNEPSDGRRERINWADYYRMNQKFANKVIEQYRAGDIVVIHDFYLMLLPSMLRQRIPNIYIAFFLHSPFPSSEFLRCLPRRKEILEGVLGSNLIGFQSYSYSRHFSSCCTRILGFPSDNLGVDAYGARVHVGVFPIGIAAAKCESYAWSEAVTEKYDALKKMYHGKKIIVGRDRLDSVRGVAQKLQAFERFLEVYPEWREKVVLIQVTSPTGLESEKEDNDSKSKIATRVNELVMRINGMYGSLGFSPVQHYPQYLTPDEYFALLRAGDIGLITSVRDGMNTTSLEYVICQRDSHGPLIISEFSGTAGSLKDAIHINPWDLTGVARDINNALIMSADKRMAMQQSLYNHVTTRNVQSWTDNLVDRLVHVMASEKSVVSTPLLDRTLMLKTYRDAKKRLIMFDYDGTLTPIVREPSAAIPSERVLHTLTALAADPKNAVWIISGRDQEFLSQHLGHIHGLGFSAEHGSFLKDPGSEDWINLADEFDMGWQTEVIDVFQRYTDRVPGAFIERKRCAVTWHYRLADPEQGVHMARDCQHELQTTVAKKWEVEVMVGKANLEVRPTFINKGEIAKRLVHTYNEKSAAEGHGGRVEFVFCLGDDFTDEDMFRSLNGMSGNEVENEHVFTVTVGASTKVTLARWHLLEPSDVIECTALLAGVGPSGEAHEHFGQVNLATLSAVEGQIPESAK